MAVGAAVDSFAGCGTNRPGAGSTRCPRTQGIATGTSNRNG